MKFSKLFLVLCVTTLLFSCSKDDENENKEMDSMMKEATTLSNDYHTVVISSKTGKLVAGYNNLCVEVKDKSGKSLEISNVSWKPMMTMVAKNHKHSCPFTTLNKDMKTPIKERFFFKWLLWEKMDIGI